MTIPEEEREVISNRLNRVAYHLEDGLGPNGLLSPYTEEQADVVRGLLDDLDYVLNWLEAQPEAPEPDWTQAPEWANWWAASVPVGLYKFTNAIWYAEKPHMRAHEWVCATNPDGSPTGKMMGAPYVDLPLGIDWRTTLRERPQS